MSGDQGDGQGQDADGLPDDDEFHASFATPDARAKEARDAALDALSRLDPDAPGTSKIDVLDGEQQAVSTWAKHAAKASEDGYPDGIVEAHAGAVAKETQNFTKPNVIGLVGDQRTRLRKAGGGTSGSGPPALDEWIEAELERVIVVETTDATQDTRWRWDFADGTVETSTTKDGITHFSWSHFRDEIYQGLGENTTKPTRVEAEEWRLWLADLIEQRGVTRETFGPRSQGAERLQEYVRDSMAYGNKPDAVERGGVYMDDDPSNGSPDELRVLSTDVKRICDDVEIEVRGLQQELDARGYTHDDVSGVSEGNYVNGKMVRFWVLTPDFSEPAAYLEEAQAPAAQAQQQGQGSSGTPTPASASATGAAQDEGAQLSSIGPDQDDPDDQSDGSDPDGGGADAPDDARERTGAHSNEQSDESDGPSESDDVPQQSLEQPHDDGDEQPGANDRDPDHDDT